MTCFRVEGRGAGWSPPCTCRFSDSFSLNVQYASTCRMLGWCVLSPITVMTSQVPGALPHNQRLSTFFTGSLGDTCGTSFKSTCAVNQLLLVNTTCGEVPPLLQTRLTAGGLLSWRELRVSLAPPSLRAAARRGPASPAPSARPLMDMRAAPAPRGHWCCSHPVCPA